MTAFLGKVARIVPWAFGRNYCIRGKNAFKKDRKLEKLEVAKACKFYLSLTGKWAVICHHGRLIIPRHRGTRQVRQIGL